MCMNPWDFPLQTATASLSHVLHTSEHPVTVSPISQSSSYIGKDIYGLPQYAHQVRPAQHKIPELTANKGWAGPCWSRPRAEGKVVLYCPQLLSRNAHQSISKQAACKGDLFVICQARALLCLVVWKIIGKVNYFSKVCSKNISVRMVPCHVRLFLHSRCDTGTKWMEKPGDDPIISLAPLIFF